MDHRRKVRLGIATIAPLLLLVVLCGVSSLMVSRFIHSGQAEQAAVAVHVSFALVACVAIWQYALVVFYVRHLSGIQTLSPRARLDWKLVMLFCPATAIGYWYKHIWRSQSPTLTGQ